MAIDSVLSRRGLMVGMAGAAVAGTVTVQKSGGVEAFARLLRPHGAGRPGVWLAKANSDDWALQIGSTFTARSGHVLKLVDVQRFPQKGTRPKGLRDRAFLARFDVVKGGKLPGNATYRVNHKRGAFDLFLDAENPARARRMTAVFN